MKYFALTAALLMSTPAFAADMKIEMLNKDAEGNRQVYSEEVARIDVGDTITWVPTNKGHNIEMVASPNNMKLRSIICANALYQDRKLCFNSCHQQSPIGHLTA